MPGKRSPGTHESSSTRGTPLPRRRRRMRTTGLPGSSSRPAAIAQLASRSSTSKTWAPGSRPWRCRRSLRRATFVRSWSSLRCETKVPRPTPRSTRPRESNEPSAWRTVMRLTPRPLASSRSGGSRSPALSSREAMRSASCSSICTCAGTSEPARMRHRSPKSRCRQVIGTDQSEATPAGGARQGSLALKGLTRIPSSSMTLDELKGEVQDGTIDTVLLAIADMQGRLQGKRLAAAHFLDEVVEHNAEGCNYLLAVDVEMDTVEGYAMSSWERGYGDFVMRPDLDTLRRIPWHPGTALVMADLEW